MNIFISKLFLCAVVVLVCLISVVPACAEEFPADLLWNYTEPITETPKVEWIKSIHENDLVVEIPKLTGVDNDAIELINWSFEDLANFYDSQNWGEKWVHCKSYITKTERYMNFVLTYIEYPNYGTKGDVTSVNYDIQKEGIIEIEEALSLGGITAQDIANDLKKNYKDNSGGIIQTVAPKAFQLLDNGEIEIYIVAEIAYKELPNQLASTIITYSSISQRYEIYDGETLTKTQFPAPMSN